MVSDRSLDVLRAIVKDYVATREPVGSKTIVDRYSFGVSAATIRNDMALLEDEELITAPHTSSGRIPTDKGYRVFVDHLSGLHPLSAAQRQAVERFLDGASDLDEVLARTVRLLSQLTHQVALVQYPSLGRAHVRHIELVPLSTTRVMSVLITDTGRVEQRLIDVHAGLDVEFLAELRAVLNTKLSEVALTDVAENLSTIADGFVLERRALVDDVIASLRDQVAANRSDKLVMAGAANLALTADDFGGSIYPVLEAIEEQVTLLKLFAEMEADRTTGLSTRIGHENASFGLGDASVIASEYTTAGGELARVGVLGPTRMDYSTNLAAVRAVARYLSRLLGDD
ncbi:MAG: heat-inducible transcriptional repressor HrcA [Cryobacterium sp.]|nr:heat-inducible transcriptional repressor HrcA [Cryobacterium sp.]